MSVPSSATYSHQVGASMYPCVLLTSPPPLFFFGSVSWADSIMVCHKSFWKVYRTPPYEAKEVEPQVIVIPSLPAGNYPFPSLARS